MEMNIKTTNKDDIERLILTINIGLLFALRENVISIEEAERFLFTPFTYEKLKAMGIKSDIAEQIYKGCEIENIKSLLSTQYTTELNKLIFESLILLKKCNHTLPEKRLLDK